MPYVRCPSCGVRTYAASHYSNLESCPACGEALGTEPALSRVFSSSLDAPPAARRSLDALTRAVDAEAMYRIRLLVTELVANAIRHPGMGRDAPIHMNVFLRRDRARIEVHDDGAGFERPVPVVPPLTENGRGLLLVDRLSERWGVDSHNGNGNTVWFEVAREAAPAGSEPFSAQSGAAAV